MRGRRVKRRNAAKEEKEKAAYFSWSYRIQSQFRGRHFKAQNL